LKELNAAEVKSKGVEFLELDLAEDDLADAVADVEIIYHCAAQPGICAQTPYEKYVRNNITATYRLIEAVRGTRPLKFFINVATSSIYGCYATDTEDSPVKPTSYYGVTKLAGEQLVLSYNRELDFPACSLRLFSVYGPRERPEKLYPQLIGSILEDREFGLFEGSENHKRSFTYVDDVIDGFVAVLANMDKCLGQIINIGWDQERSTGDGIRVVEEILGKKARCITVPKRTGDQLRTCANITKARELLGYDPKTTLMEGLTAEVEWYKEKIFGKIQY
jgi:UDP-glucuronate 4-epimerase